ncbi:hypothetical protein X741_27295 [Mesorhizobium sp. LNHC229A00]|nr:hypothetical protein X741_27295 [Mesorhizobium sp. LNHC229A00]
MRWMDVKRCEPRREIGPFLEVALTKADHAGRLASAMATKVRGREYVSFAASQKRRLVSSKVVPAWQSQCPKVQLAQTGIISGQAFRGSISIFAVMLKASVYHPGWRIAETT